MFLRKLQIHIIILIILFCGLSLPVKADEDIPQITIVYPKEEQVVGAVGVSGVKSSEDAQIARAGIGALGL